MQVELANIWLQCHFVVHQAAKSQDKVIELEDYLEARDYAGAVTYLTFKKSTNESSVETLEWLAYAHYHNWEHAEVHLSCAVCVGRPCEKYA